jgi:predicted nucleic acid-binding protein
VARKALEWYVEKNVDWTDTFVAAKMAAGKKLEIYSYDRHFDKFPEIKRIEP